MSQTVFGIDGRGDGVHLDTAAVQDAIDRCHAAGGGMVVCPKGVYRIGTIELKSNVRLHLTAGAVLKGSTRREDYRTIHTGIESREFLVYAEDADNIALTGQGAIDGSGTHFFEPIPGKQRMRVRDWRPYHMLTFRNCRDVLVRDVKLLDAPCYSIWPHGCERVRITGVTIIANRWGPNTDGIDPDCCRDVIISDCFIDCGDDCIAIKSDIAKLGRSAACENIVVSNCTMRTTCCGVRLGYEGDGPIRNCTFSNLVMHETRTGIDILVPRDVRPKPAAPGGVTHGIEHGPAIENIRFANLTLDTQIAFNMWIGDDAAPPGSISNVSMAHVTATTEQGCHISGSRTLPIQDIAFNDVTLTMRSLRRPPLDDPMPYPFPPFGVWARNQGVPHAWFVRYADGVTMRHVTVDWRNAGHGWRSTVRAEHCTDVDLHHLAVRGLPPKTDAPVLDFAGVRRSSIRGTRSVAEHERLVRHSNSDIDIVA